MHLYWSTYNQHLLAGFIVGRVICGGVVGFFTGIGGLVTGRLSSAKI